MDAESPIRRTQEEWDGFFYGLAEQSATLSKDPDRQVGAVLVAPNRRQLSFGYNGFPPEVPDLPSLLADRDFKLANMRHAEHNCLDQAPFFPGGASLYVTCFPCVECAIKIREARVARVVAPRPDFGHRRWGKSWKVSVAVLSAAGVGVRHVP